MTPLPQLRAGSYKVGSHNTREDSATVAAFLGDGWPQDTA
jgi:hypothetical protein